MVEQVARSELQREVEREKTVRLRVLRKGMVIIDKQQTLESASWLVRSLRSDGR